MASTLSASCLAIGLAFSAQAIALTPKAEKGNIEKGKALFATCNSCHEQALNPPKAPPMWAIQRRYQKQTANKKEFIQRVVDFVKAPSEEQAIFKGAIQHLGLMPALPLPDSQLNAVASYLYETDFPPPCDHWKHATERYQQRGDNNQAQRHRKKWQRFCQDKK